MLPRSVAFALLACVVLPRPLAAVMAFFSLCCSGSLRVVAFGSVVVFAVLWPALFCVLGWLSVTLSPLMPWENSPSFQPRVFYLPSGERAPRRILPSVDHGLRRISSSGVLKPSRTLPSGDNSPRRTLPSGDNSPRRILSLGDLAPHPTLPSGVYIPRRIVPIPALTAAAAAPALPTLGGVSSCAVDPSCGGVNSALSAPLVASSGGVETVVVSSVVTSGAVVPCSVAPVVPSSGGALSVSVAPSVFSSGDDSVMDSIVPTFGGAELEALELPAGFENDFLAFGDEVLAAFAVPPAFVDVAPPIGDVPVALPDAPGALDGVLDWEDWVQDFPAAPFIGDADALFEGLLDFGGDVPPLPETPEEFDDTALAIDNGWPDALAAPLDNVASSSGLVVSSASPSLPLSNGSTGSAVVVADATSSGGVLPRVFGDDFRAAWSTFGLPTDTVDALAHAVDLLGMPPPMPFLPDEIGVDGLGAPPFPLEGVITPAPVVGGSVVAAGAGAPFVGFGPLDVVDEDVIMGNVEEVDRAHVDQDDPMGIQGDVAMVYGRGTWRRRAMYVHGGMMARPLGVPARRYAGPFVRRYKGSPSWSW